MDETYGKRQYKLGTLPMVYMPEVCLEVALIIVFGVLLNHGIKTGHVFSTSVVVSFLLAAVVMVIVIRLIFICRVEVYDKAVAVFTQFNSHVYPADQISAIIWSMPGENPINSRAARTNNTIVELIIKNQHKSVKLSDAYYRNLEKPLSAFQTENSISSEL